jgi:hypothetical protein
MDNFNLKQYLVENKVTRNSKLLSELQFKVGDKVDVFNPKGKYSGESWWGPDEFLYNAEVVQINGQKTTVKDINDDEYEVDTVDIK